MAEHPGLHLGRLLEVLGTSQRRLAAALEMQPSQLNEIIKGKRPITVRTCLLLGKLCIGNSKTWWQKQCDYEYDQAAQGFPND